MMEMTNAERYADLRGKKTRKQQNYEVRNAGRADLRARNDQRKATAYGRARGNI